MPRPAPFNFDYDLIKALPEAERKEAIAQIAFFQRKVESNPLWAYVPHEGELEFKQERGKPITGHEERGQVEYHEASQRGLFSAAIVAGNRFGKTHAGVVDDLVQTLPDVHLPPWLRQYRRRPYTGDSRCRVVVVDIPNALTKVMLPKVRQLVPREALWKGDWQKAYNDRTRMLQFEDGSWWDFLTHDMDVDAFAGADLDRIHFDEEPPGEKGKLQYDESLTRLIDRDGDVRFTLTPLLGLNWVFYELTRDGEPRDDDECKVVVGAMEHNPHLAPEMQERLRKKWAKEPLKMEARMHGRFVHFAGLVFDEFREDRHVVPDRSIPRRDRESKPEVPIYGSIDPGIDHPAALVFFWITTDDVAEVFYAEKWEGLIVENVAQRFHDFTRAHNFTPRWTTIDPSGRNRNPQTGRDMQWAFQQHGLHTLPGQNARGAGYDIIKERLRTDRLLVHASCPALVEEFKSYRWKQHKGQSEEKKMADVIKVNDDILDALRYGLMSMPVKARQEVPLEALSSEERALRHSLRNMGRRNRRQRVGASYG